MELIDCHSHSAYSGHGSGTVTDMVYRAQELGLSVFAQTEHLVLPEGMDPEFESSMSHQTMNAYINELADLEERLAYEGSSMELIRGIEADWLDNRTEELKQLCASFDYVLGSVHFLERRPFDNPADMSIWDDYGVDGIWERYVRAWLDMVLAPGPITCFAHPDLPKLYGGLPSFDLHDYYAEMARAVAASGRMVEVNTAGLRKDAHEMCPSLDLLRAFFDAGVDCTVGSDAHCPKDVACGIREAYALMYEAGYRTLTIPRVDEERSYIALEV